MEMMTQSCSNCQFWDRHTGGIDGELRIEGACRRFPPVLSEALTEDKVRSLPEEGVPHACIESNYAWIFPITEEDEWCGEWREESVSFHNQKMEADNGQQNPIQSAPAADDHTPLPPKE